MTTLTLNTNPSFSIDVSVRESDHYTEMVLLKIDRHFDDNRISSRSEMYMTTGEIKELGNFLITQAEHVESIQYSRKTN